LTAFAETDWSVVIGAVGAAVVLVVGALGGWYLKILSARAALDQTRRAADEKARAATAAADRREKRDTTDELYRLLDAKEKDIQEYRDLIHGFRDDMGLLSNRLAVCEYDRTRLRMAVEDQGEAIREHGIQVHYRPVPGGPVEMHGPAPEAPAQ
jgi:hypothetical protein